jgi:chromosome segregation ATPase
MSEKPKFMTHERIMAGEEYVSYSDYLLLQRERDEAREKAERYRLEANAMMMQRDEAREEINRYREKLDLLPISWDV